MAVWTVWEHDRYEDPARAERAIFVRDGFSCLAFLFGPVWLLFHGMIVVFVGFVLVAAGANVAAAHSLGGGGAFAVSLVIALWFGFEATTLRRWALSRRGWRLVGVVEARRRVDAERRYYTERLAPVPDTPPPAVPSSPAPWGPQPQEPVLGLFPEGPR